MTAISLFSVPVWKNTLPDFQSLKDPLLCAVRTYKKDNPSGDNKSNLWGYQSPKTLHSISEMRPLFDYVYSVALSAAESIGLRNDIAIMEAWANFNVNRQSMNHQHTHGGVFSGIFYLNVPDDSGTLALVNPAMNPMWEGLGLVKHPSQYTSESVIIHPVEGEVILWPSYLPHSVGTNNHDDERISVAFNLYARR